MGHNYQQEKKKEQKGKMRVKTRANPMQYSKKHQERQDSGEIKATEAHRPPVEEA